MQPEEDLAGGFDDWWRLEDGKGWKGKRFFDGAIIEWGKGGRKANGEQGCKGCGR